MRCSQRNKQFEHPVALWMTMVLPNTIFIPNMNTNHYFGHKFTTESNYRIKHQVVSKIPDPGV
jgi:hypothetical protein